MASTAWNQRRASQGKDKWQGMECWVLSEGVLSAMVAFLLWWTKLVGNKVSWWTRYPLYPYARTYPKSAKNPPCKHAKLFTQIKSFFFLSAFFSLVLDYKWSMRWNMLYVELMVNTQVRQEVSVQNYLPQRTHRPLGGPHGGSRGKAGQKTALWELHSYV